MPEPSANQVQVALTERETTQAQRMLSDPTVFPQIFKNWVSAWTEQDVSIALAQVQGWNDYLNDQTAKDTGQDSGIATNASGVSSLQGSVTSQGSDISALQNSQASQDSTIAGQGSTLSTHSGQISTLQTSDASQNSRLTALEAKKIPYVIATSFTPTSRSAYTVEQTLAQLTLPANVLPLHGIVEFRASGTWYNSTGTSHPPPTLKVTFGTTLVAQTAYSGSVSSSANAYYWEVVTRLMNTTDTSHQKVSTVAYIGDDAVIYMPQIAHFSVPTNVTTTTNRPFVLSTVETYFDNNFVTTCDTTTLTFLAA